MTNTKWTAEDADQARRQGWDIFDAHGSDNGPWQLESFDEPDAWPMAPSPYPFEGDTDVWEFVRKAAAEGDPLACKALAFLAEHNPIEYKTVIDWEA